MADGERFYITKSDLASYLGQPETGTIGMIVNLTNGLINDEWRSPVDPVPFAVKAIALNVAVRAGSNPKGLTSWTRSWDDITRTERVETARRLGVYLEDDELATLHGTERPVVRRVRSIPMRAGWRC